MNKRTYQELELESAAPLMPHSVAKAQHSNAFAIFAVALLATSVLVFEAGRRSVSPVRTVVSGENFEAAGLNDDAGGIKSMSRTWVVGAAKASCTDTCTAVGLTCDAYSAAYTSTDDAGGSSAMINFAQFVQGGNTPLNNPNFACSFSDTAGSTGPGGGVNNCPIYPVVTKAGVCMYSSACATAAATGSYSFSCSATVVNSQQRICPCINSNGV